ncbi:MAG: DUF1840 domain-containing protein [Rhodocyclales bacterium]|nr:DUF1840 domain-containing protein [Rhodocyclales bacterium]
MIVQFDSTETAEVLMFAEVAKVLLTAVGKECTARGVFTQSEMLPAAMALREAVRQAGKPVEDDEEEDKKKPPVISLGQRAWPLIDMLERTAKSGPDASIVWEAAADF